MTAQVNNSTNIFDEISSVAAAATAARDEKTVSVTTRSGRTYEVGYVIETSAGEWMPIAERVRGLYKCAHCPEGLLPGGNWVQVRLKQGGDNGPVVRLHDSLLHLLTKHKDSPEAQQHVNAEKIVNVFASS